MKHLNTLISLGIILSISFSQIYNPETGEVINKKEESQVLFDPVTGEIIKESAQKKMVTSVLDVRQHAYWDARNNFNTKTTWAVLGGGISLISIPPLAGLGSALGGGWGFISGLTTSVYGVPIYLSKMESNPSNFVLHQPNYQSLTPDQKIIYIYEYSREIKKNRVKAMRKGQIGWFIGGLGSLIFLSLAFG